MVRHITILIEQQSCLCYEDNNLAMEFLVSTAKQGIGQKKGSYQTPLGKHTIRAKIGADQPIGTVFVGRRPTGEVWNPVLHDQFPDRDWVLTRILWLSGIEIGHNRLGDVDTMQRYIYIHGTPDVYPMGAPASHGCVRMQNDDIVRLFDWVDVGTQVVITPSSEYIS